MELQTAIFLSGAVFALLQFGFLPRLKKTWARLPFDKQLKRFGVLAALDKVRDYALIALICLGIFTVLLYAFSIHAGATSESVIHVLERLRSAKEALSEFKKSWTVWIFFVSFLLLWAAWYRSAKRYATETLSELRRKEYDRLAKLRDEHPEQWEDLPANAQMAEIWDHLQACLRDLESPQSANRSDEQRAKQIEYVQKLSTVWTLMDFDRRLEIPWETEEVAPDGIIGKVSRLLTSRGLLSDMKGVGKLLSHASFGLLTLSMIGFAALSANESLAERMAHLSDLAISSATVENQAELRAEEQKQPNDSSTNTHPINASDLQHIRRLSKQLARQVRNEDHWANVDSDLRNEAAKENIRENTVLHSTVAADQGQTGVMPDFTQTATADDVLADQIASKLSDEARKNSSFLEKIRLWGARYHEPAEIDELRSFFVEQAVDAIFEPIPKPKSPWMEKVSDLATDTVKKSASKMVELNADRLMVNMMRDTPEETAWAQTRAMGSIDALLSPELTERLRKQFPSTATQKDWAANLRKMRTAVLSREDVAVGAHSTDILADMPRWTLEEDRSSLAALVSTYESQFPLEAKNYSRDDLFASIGELSKHQHPHGMEATAILDSDPVQARATRVGDIEALRNYSRVGGVLIGALPRSKSALHVRDINWETTGGIVRLTLRRADGGLVTLGPFDPETVNRSLAYVVDGRPVAVTVLNAELIDRDQVMMSPALRDSLFGAQIGRADEWIFDFLDPDVGGGQTPLRKQELALYGVTGLYNVALDFVKSGKPDPTDGSFGKLRGITNSSDFDLFAHKLGFDYRLLEIAKRCLVTSMSSEQYGKCVVTQTGDAAMKKDLASLTKPRTAVVSQIFEQPYDLDENLTFLQRSENDDQLWPLQFTVQMTINDKDHITVPEFEGGARSGSTTWVIRAIESHGETPILQRLQDFTILQRLFRAALNGGLGGEFPVEKLGNLAQATKQTANSCPTPRWLHRPRPTGETTESAVATVLRETPASSKFQYPESSEVGGSVRKKIMGCSDLLGSPNADLLEASLIENKCKLFDDERSVALSCIQNEGKGSEACSFLNSQLDVSLVVGIHRVRETLSAVRAPAKISPSCQQIH